MKRECALSVCPGRATISCQQGWSWLPCARVQSSSRWTRNCRLERVSQRKRRPLLRPAAEATTGDRPPRFLTRCRVVCIAELLLQMCDGNSTVGCLEREREP